MSIIEQVRTREKNIDDTLAFHTTRNLWLQSAEAFKTLIRQELCELSIDPIPYYVRELEKIDDILAQFGDLI